MNGNMLTVLIRKRLIYTTFTYVELYSIYHLLYSTDEITNEVECHLNERNMSVSQHNLLIVLNLLNGIPINHRN